MTTNKPEGTQTTSGRVHDPKTIKQPDNSDKRVDTKDRPNDGDIANPVDATDFQPRPPNDPDPQESWGAKQARVARENEKALGEGKPEPHPHD